MAKEKQEQRSIVKVVYFDQDTASDYLDIVAGGSLESTKETIGTRTVETHASVEAKLSVSDGRIVAQLRRSKSSPFSCVSYSA